MRIHVSIWNCRCANHMLILSTIQLIEENVTKLDSNESLNDMYMY